MNDQSVQTSVKYLSGFGSHHETEALEGALPVGRNSPREVAFGLYAEQLSGTAFTAPRAQNLRSWLYRLRPSAAHGPFEQVDDGLIRTGRCREAETSPNRLRWAPLPMPADRADFVAGLATYATCGEARAQHGAGIHLYCANRSMAKRVFHNADGEMLFVPQEGAITLATELGRLDVAPGEIAVVPRGMKFRVLIHGAAVRGYVCENYGAPFRLPDLGLIGSNGLANPRDFQSPSPHIEDRDKPTDDRRQVRRPPLERDARPFAARRRRLARQLLSVQVRPRALQRDE